MSFVRLSGHLLVFLSVAFLAIAAAIRPPSPPETAKLAAPTTAARPR